MIAALVGGLLAGCGIAIPVGAVGACLVALSARTSWRVGAGAALGVATADGLYALIAVAGGATLVPVLQPVTVPLRWASALVLVVLAVRVPSPRSARTAAARGRRVTTPVTPRGRSGRT